MSLSVLQYAKTTSTATSGTSTSVTASFTGNISSQSLIVANITVENGFGVPVITSVTTNGTAENWTQTQADANSIVFQWHNWNTAGGTKNIVVNLTFGGTASASSTNTTIVELFEIGGAWTSSNPLDQTAVSDNGNLFVTSWSSGNITTLNANDIAIGVNSSNIQSSATFTQTGPGSPWTNETTVTASFITGGSTVQISQLSGFNILSTTQTLSYAGTTNTSTEDFTIISTFKAAPTGPVVQPDIPSIQPGPTWLSLFKPGMPRPRPVVPPDPYQGPILNTSDIPQVNPGPMWMDHFKPQIPRPRPVNLDSFKPVIPGVISGLTSSISIQANYGSVTVSPHATQSSVAIQSNYGAARVNPQGIKASVNIAANFGSIAVKPQGLRAAVSVQANFGSLTNKLTGLRSAVAVVANTGTARVNPQGITSRINIAANTGSLKISAPGLTAHVNVVAHVGNAVGNTVVQGLVSSVTVSPYYGKVTVSPSIRGSVSISGLYGSPRVLTPGLRAAVTISSVPSFRISIPGVASVNSISGHYGAARIQVNGFSSAVTSSGHSGSIVIRKTLPPAFINIKANIGTAVVKILGATSSVQARSTVSISLNVPGNTAQENTSALYGTVRILVANSASSVTVKAWPQGVSYRGITAGNNIAANIGSVKIITSLPAVRITATALTGISGTSSMIGFLSAQQWGGKLQQGSSGKLQKILKAKLYTRDSV